MAVTMKQVASRAKVSDTTVARVLDGYPHISYDIVERVNQAIQELGYVPNRKKRSARNSESFASIKPKTGLVGFLLAQWAPDYLAQPLMAEIMAATEKHLTAQNMQMVFTQLGEPDILPAMIAPDRLDGLLLMGQCSHKLRKALKGHNVVLMLGGPRHTGDDYWADGIGSDYPACGYLAARYLIDRGHKNIAFLNPIFNHGGFQEIGWTFSAVAKHNDIKCLMLTSDFYSRNTGIWDRKQSQEAMYHQFKKITELPVEQQPTGLHVPADDFTVLAYEVLSDLGIKPGIDIEVVSRRNQEIYLSQMNPRPATVDLNADEIGRRATEKLLSRIANPKAPVGARLLIPPKLVMPR
ncbi:MAG: LacI family DNA-binding transcriptional regulator [Phycisphaerae bacterium]|nr:LacI family DNA-binding transcriptional regulator [Phycisphaerae bacterium]